MKALKDLRQSMVTTSSARASLFSLQLPSRALCPGTQVIFTVVSRDSLLIAILHFYIRCLNWRLAETVALLAASEMLIILVGNKEF